MRKSIQALECKSQSSTENSTNQGPKTILIIDDNESITGLFSRYIGMKGLKCQVSNDGKNGIEFIKSKKFDTILLDLSMPGMSGYDVIDILEKEGRLEQENIVVFTAASVSSQEIETMRNRGIKGFVQKPVTVNQLLEHLGLDA